MNAVFWTLSERTDTHGGIGLACRLSAGDKAYLSDGNINVCAELPIKTCIPIKRGWKADTKSSYGLRELFDFYTTENAFFEVVYRYHDKIESVFSAVKRVCATIVVARTRLPTRAH